MSVGEIPNTADSEQHSGPSGKTRRRVLIAGLLATAVLLAVALVSSRPDGTLVEDIPWAPLEAGADGTSLVVRPTGTFSNCDGPVEVRYDAAEGGIRMRYRRVACSSLAGRTYDRMNVSLGRPLRAEWFRGVNPQPVQPVMSADDEGPRHPRVIGLSVGAAREVLSANGFNDVRLVLPTGREVRAQDTAAAPAGTDPLQVTHQRPTAGSKRARTSSGKLRAELVTLETVQLR